MRGGALKKDMTKDDDSPFSVLFEYGANGDGYWTYDHMVLQLEDVVDVLDALFSVPWDGRESPHNVFVKSEIRPKTLVRKYEYLFLTDHSCGHDRKRPDGLDVTSLRKGPTSAAKKMRDVQITNGIGIISGKSNHPMKLKVGDTQKLVFGDVDNFGNPETGPFYWTAENRAKFKYDQIEGVKIENLLVAELRDALKRHNVDFRGRRADLIQRCQRHVPPIPTTKEVPNIVHEGWYKKSKGLLQILWERGYIDASKLRLYTMHGPRGEDGNIQLQYSLNHLIRQCSDFVDEPTMLQYIGEEKLGITVDRTPINWVHD